MKKFALTLILLLTINTTLCMKGGVPRHRKPQALPSFTKDIIEDDHSCCDFVLDLGLSCCAGSALAYSAYHIFDNNPLATTAAFTIGTLTVFSIQTGEPFKETHAFDQKEKTD